MMQDVYKEKGRVFIADMGGAKDYWNIVPPQIFHEYNVKITIINLPRFSCENDDDVFRFVGSEACDLSCFGYNSFDTARSNSVIEHVGDWNRMVKFADELKRVAPKYFVQTPNYWFPIEHHSMTPFFHWLLRPFRVWLVINFQLCHWSRLKSVGQAVLLIESVQLWTKKMIRR